MMSFLLLANFWGLLFLAVYFLIFKNTHRFKVIKAYIILAIIGSVALPWVSMHDYWVSTADDLSFPSVYYLDEFLYRQTDAVTPAVYKNPWMIYGGISAMAILVYGIRLGMFRWQLKKLSTDKIDGMKVILNARIGPGSFFDCIILPAANTDSAIFFHEKAHVIYKHYWQRVTFSILQCLFFPVGAVHLFKKEWLLINEYQADQYALKHCEDYPNTLINSLLHTQIFSPLQLFFHHPIKQRIIMMTSKKRPSILLAGIAVITMTCSGMYLQAQVQRNPTSVSVMPLPDKDNKIDNNHAASMQKTELPLKTVEVKARYLGNLSEDLSKSIIYPEVEKGKEESGRINVQFVVNKEGKVESVEALGSAMSEVYKEAAINAVKTLPGLWQPGTNKGQKVSMVFVLPISFVFSEVKEDPK